jgi:7,8-dihydropterin-6-yl-methyl-4-(beta-D-ribofuranosyl)aminobenzene 5'-phosphate synthase
MDIELIPAEPFAAPVVDSLSVRVLVDSAYDRFISDATHPVVKIEHVRHIPGHERSTFAGEWGLSLHLESAQAGGKSQYLLDFGYTPEVLIRNFDLLDLDPARIDGLILSHGHRDHYGGLDGFVAHHRAYMPPEVKLFTGGESAFAEKWIKRRNADPVSWGTLDRSALEAGRVATVCCDRAQALAGPFTTGPIPRIRLSGYWRAHWSNPRLPPPSTTSPKPNARVASSPTSIRTSTRLAMSCRGAGWSSSRHADTSG